MKKLRSLLRNVQLFWTTFVPQTWDKLPFDQKLAWVVFSIYTLALITIFELFLLRR